MADKKITELPFIDTLSGSLVGDNSPLQNTVIPLVLRGNTNQINIENFSKFVTAYSAHTGSAGNIFTGPQTINNNVTINGRLTVREIVSEYETASILFSTGSTKLGDQITDKHEFTGSTNITGSFIVNGANLTDFSASNSTLFTNYSSSVSQSISSYSSSNSTTFTNLSSSNSTTFTNLSSSNSTTFTNLSSSNSTTFTNLSSSNSTLFTNYSSSVSQSISSYSSSNSTTFTNLSSSNSTTFTNYSSSTATSINGLSLGIGAELARVYQTTASLNVQTGSQNSLNTSLGLITSSIYGEITSFNSVFQRIGSTTSSMNIQSGSQDLVNLGISSVTGSLIGITNTLMAFTAALDNTYATDAQLYQLYQATSSIQFTTRSLNTQTGSQDLVNLTISTYTGSQNVINSSVDTHILKQATQTGSQDLVNLGISSVTGSLIGITNGLMAFTAALDNTYATDAQLYQLYHATSSLNIQTGSQDLVNLGISTYTGSQNVINSSVDTHILKQATQTGSQDLVNLGISSVTGSLIGITNGLMAFTAALDTTYATDAQLYQLYQATASIHFTTQSLNTQTGSQDLVNLDISTFTGSLRSEIDLIEAYTASLKAAVIVSSSQQITNYYKFAETASANVFFGKQSISGALHVANGITGSVKGNLDGVAGYASTVAVANTGTTTDTTLFPIFSLSPVLASYTNLYSHASSSFFYNGVTRRLHMEGLVVSGSNNNVEISGSFNVSGSTNLTGSVTINESRIDNGWTAYTPEWTAASSNPAINNGTIEGYYKVIGKTCFVRGNIAMGSTTTFGTGEWYVSMPFTASHADAILMSANLLDNGSGWYNATMAGARAGFNHKAPIQYQTAGGTAGDVNATAPFTWASTDRFMWNGSYEIA